jgi:D-alanyl-D-alanine-carboxypeptidase/D-alanyl-D-alanine-endopeptidase
MPRLVRARKKRQGTVMSFRVRIAFAAALAGLGISLGAAAQRATKADIDSDVQRIFTESGARGMVVTIVRRDQVSVRGYGETRPGSGRRPDGQSLLRINSISKLFAGDLLGTYVQEGRIDLDEPLQRYAPQGRHVPSAITLGQLATHTSGLPRSADLKGIEQPYEVARWTWLERQTQLPVPGRSARYSNIGFDLLADALANKIGTPYVQLLAQRVTGPLGLADTTAAPNEAQCARLLDAGGPDTSLPCRDQTQYAGSGGLYSTANDIGLWIRTQLAADRRAQSVQVRRNDLTSVEGLDLAGPIDGVGLAWVHLAADDNHPALIEKTGGGGGFMSYLVLVPDADVGLFVAVTKVDGEVMKKLTRRSNDLAGLLAR